MSAPQKTVFQYVMEDSPEKGSRPSEFFDSVFKQTSIEVVERAYTPTQTGRDAYTSTPDVRIVGKEQGREVKPNAQSNTAKQATKKKYALSAKEAHSSR